MTALLLNDLKRDEGWRSFAYLDTEGLTTIGYGFCIDEKRGTALPLAVADLWLSMLVDNITKELESRLPWLKNQPEDVKRALGNMSFNLGVPGLLNFAKMLAALKAGDRATAASEALQSKWAGQVGVRATRIAALIRG